MAIDRKLKILYWGPFLYDSAVYNGIELLDLSNNVLFSIDDAGITTSTLTASQLVVTDANKKLASQAPTTALGSLTDSTGGTPNNTLVAISGSGDDANINNNFADLVGKVNNILSRLRTAKVIAT